MKETGFSHPISQVELQQLKLQNWFLHKGHTNIPIYYFVAISDPSTVIKVSGDADRIARVVAHGQQIPQKILDIEKIFEKRKKEKSLENSNNIIHQKLGNAILQECTDFDLDIMSKLEIKQSDLKPGLRCVNCGWIGMEKRERDWQCKKCNHTDKLAFLPAIEDYLMLYNSRITNKECRNYLNENSRHAVTRIFKKSPLIYDSITKAWMKE